MAADYGQLGKLIGEVKRAAIDAYMTTENPYEIDGDQYRYEGSGRGMTQYCTRPGGDGEGGGDVWIDGWFDWGTGDDDVRFQARFNEIRGMIDTLFSNLKDLPDGTALAPYQTKMEEAAQKLTPTGADAQSTEGGGSALDLNNPNLDSRVSMLHGLSYRLSSLTINAFRESYADRLRPVLNGQAAIASIHALALAADQAVLLKLRDDTIAFATNARDSLNALATAKGAPEGKAAFAIGGAILAIASLSVTGPAAIALGSGGALSGLAADLWPEPPKKVDIVFQGSSLNSMMQSISDGKTKMLEAVIDDEEAIQLGLTNAKSKMADSPRAFEIGAPAYPQSGPGQEGLNGPGTIIQDRDDMQRLAGTCQLIGDTIEEAHGLVEQGTPGWEPWQRPSGIGVHVFGPHHDNLLLSWDLQPVLKQMAADMQAGAVKLIKASTDFDATDAEAAQLLGREIREIRELENR